MALKKRGIHYEWTTHKIVPPASAQLTKPGANLATWRTDLGGNPTHVHALHKWNDYDARDAQRAGTAPHYADLEPLSAISLVEATQTLQTCGLLGADKWALKTPKTSALVAWEQRRYQLKLGYDSVPTFLSLYESGLSDKLAADDSGASELVTLLYSDNGSLNVVIELWRHESIARAQDSRVASRKATKWRSAINEIAHITTSFETQFMRPIKGSPWTECDCALSDSGAPCRNV